MQPGDEADEIEPVRADIPDGTQGAAFAGFDTPVVVRGKATNPADSCR